VAWENRHANEVRVSYELEQGQTATVSGATNTLPLTFAFRTQHGTSGLLQITGFIDNPRAVKIRYKLVQEEISTAAYPGDWIWESNSQNLDRVPPIFLLQRSTLPETATSFAMMGNNRCLARGKTIQELIELAWSQKNSAIEIHFEASLPQERFDFIVASQAHWWDKLETEINRRFQLTEQVETRAGRDLVLVKQASAN